MAATSNMVDVTLCGILSQVPPSKEEVARSVQWRVFLCMSLCRSNREKKEKKSKKKQEHTEVCIAVLSY